jgi:hypothetical protein
MDWTQLAANIQSPFWWIGSVISGLATIAVAYFLQKAISALLSVLSERWRLRQTKAARRETRLIDTLASSQSERIMFAFDELRDRTFAIVFMIFAAVLTFMAMFFTIAKEPSHVLVITALGVGLNLALGCLNLITSTRKAILLHRVKLRLSTTIPSTKRE